MHLLKRQYLYFCTIKLLKRQYQLLNRQYLYFCTSSDSSSAGVSSSRQFECEGKHSSAATARVMEEAEDRATVSEQTHSCYTRGGRERLNAT